MVAFISINIFFFAVTWGLAANVVVKETFPFPIHSHGDGLSAASN
jgi:hypothetical protein